MPHALMGNRKIQHADNFVSFCLGSVAGYAAVLEQTMFVGAYNDGTLIDLLVEVHLSEQG